jgi:hypothetical protein
MRLDGFLKSAGRAMLAPTHPVSFTDIGLTKDRQQFKFSARAQLVFVDEEERAAILSEARSIQPDPELQQLEVAYRTLLVALRDIDDPAVRFADDVTQLRKALVSVEGGRLMREYQDFVKREFPEQPTASDLAEVASEAEGNS